MNRSDLGRVTNVRRATPIARTDSQEVLRSHRILPILSIMTDPSATRQRRAPVNMDELGVPRSLVEDLFMRRLVLERVSTVSGISEALGISASIGRDVADDLRDRHVVEYQGLEGRDYRAALTELGNRVALDRMHTSTYASTVPVSLKDYTATVLGQRAASVVNRESIRAAFSDLVIEDHVLDQLGPAFMNEGAIFLYGPPGTGKTSLAERLIRIHRDSILVPWAVTVDGSIISVFDPSVHQALPEQPPDMDPRWVLCERPIVIVGGEMDLKMVELEYDTVSGIYNAPLQMVANNGILVVDDFGRQGFRPDALLNRWIMPLARGVDFLRLGSGTKMTIPFELKLVASTNLDPKALGDEAFLRRLRNKVYIGPISENAFNWILVRVAKARGIDVNADDAAYLRSVAIQYIGELRPYLVTDFCELMEGICAYEQVPKRLDRDMIDRVAAVYFVNTMDGAGDAADFCAPHLAPEPVSHLATVPASLPASALSSI